MLALFAAANARCFRGAQFTVVFVFLAVVSNLVSLVLVGRRVEGGDRSVVPSTTASLVSCGIRAACPLGLYATANVPAAVATATTSALHAVLNIINRCRLSSRP